MKYGSIPQDPDAVDGADNIRVKSSSRIRTILIVVAVALAGFLLVRRSIISKKKVAPDNGQWPQFLMKYGGKKGIISDGPIFGPFDFNYYPTTTAEASDAGWIKFDTEPCNPLMGEPWRVGGDLRKANSVTLYFTPQVGDTPGVVSGISVAYFGYVEESLIGTYLTEAKTASDGSAYHSLVVALRNSSENLCDTSSPAEPGNPAYVLIAPGMANYVLPVQENDPELQENWFEGACMPFMGYHWFQDVVSGSDFSFRTENFVPIIPMYSSVDGILNGIFFFSATSEQYKNPNDGGAFTKTPWDANTVGLWAETRTKAFPIVPPSFCSNFCGETCEFVGGDPESEFFHTMHFFFRDTLLFGEHSETCGFAVPSYCRSGLYPPHIPHFSKLSILGVGILIVAILVCLCKRCGCCGC